MAGAWERQETALGVILHTDNTTLAWAFGLRALDFPGHFTGLAGMPFDHARNAGAQRALDMGVDWLFFLDSDVIPPHDAVRKLISRRKAIISGVYHRRSPPHGVPVMLKGGKWLDTYPVNSIIDVDLVGAGCLLIHTSVLRNLPPQREGKHWFDWRVDRVAIDPPGTAMSEDFTFCFPSTAWVGGERVKRIGEVKVKDRVVNHTGAMAKILQTSSREYTGEVVNMRACYMGSLVSTAGHKYLVRTTRPSLRPPVMGVNGLMSTNTKKKLWLEASEIRVGDWLYVPKTRFRKSRGKVMHDGLQSLYLTHYITPRSLTRYEDGTWGYSRTRKSSLRIANKIPITPDLCRLLGYYIAEGFSRGVHGRSGGQQTAQWGFHKDEKEYIDDCRAILMKEFGAESTVYYEGNAANIVVSSKLMGRLLSALCGNGSRKKRLPRFWNKLSRECLSELICGYWRGDGTNGDAKAGNYSMVTVSEQLARDVQAAIIKLGVLAGVDERTNVYGLIYTISIPRKLSSRFGAIVRYDCGEVVTKKQRRYFRETDTHFLVQVRSHVTSVQTLPVYNLKVKGRETYTMNGVAVHNCTHAIAHGYKVYVDTSILCKHVGLAEAGYKSLQPLETAGV